MVPANTLTYLPWVILVMLGEYLALIVIVAIIYNLQLAALRIRDRGSFLLYFSGPSFEMVYLSFPGKGWLILLFITRLLSFLYFCVTAFIWNLVRFDGNNIIFFSVWHIIFIVIYYLFAAIASLIGIVFEDDRRAMLDSLTITVRQRNVTRYYWSSATLAFASLIQIMFEVGGAVAFFITLSVYLQLAADFTFWNVTQHLVTSFSFLLELLLNRIYIRWEHILFNQAWLLIYLIVIWPLVATGALAIWPYAFLRTDSVDAIVYYSIAAAISVGFYLFWWILGIAKHSCWRLETEYRDTIHMDVGDRDEGRRVLDEELQSKSQADMTKNPSAPSNIYL